MSNPISSVIFLGRNIDKVKHGDAARTPVAIAQATNLVQKVSQLDNTIGKTTQSAVNVLDKTTSGVGSKVLGVAGKAVNPLLVGAAAVRVATSDDKEETLCKEAGGMTVMFGAERFVKSDAVQRTIKNNTDECVEAIAKKMYKIIDPLNDYAQNSGNKYVKVASAIVSGLALVGASILGYDAGAKLGENLVHAKRKNKTDKESDQTNYTATTNTPIKTGEKLSIES